MHIVPYIKFKRSDLVSVCSNWDQLVQLYKHSPTHFHLLFFLLWRWLHFWFIKYQFACLPAMILLLSQVHPQLCPLHNNTSLTALTAAPMMPCCVCLHSVISLLTVGMLSVFVSPFSFFMHSTTLRRSSASPANSSMFSPHTLALLSFCILHHYSSFSSSFSCCRHFGLVLVALSWDVS